MNRLIGIILIVLGVIIGVIAVAFLFTNPAIQPSARILGLAIVLIVPVAPLIGVGIYLSVQGRSDAKQQVEAATSRQLLNMVQSRGSLPISDAAIELHLSKEQIRAVIYNLVGLGVFNGYINWDKAVLYSSDASKLREMTKCPNCGGEITLAGKGVAKCRFCGTEFFLS